MRIQKTSQYIKGGLSTLDIYPVGSIYMSVNSTNPSTLFGGTWEQLQDTFLLGAGSTYTAGDVGGEATHTLSVNEIPTHTHGTKIHGTGNPTWSGQLGPLELAHSVSGNHNYNGSYSEPLSGQYFEFNSGGTDASGGGQSHNNMPPYLVVYMWKRTA